MAASAGAIVLVPSSWTTLEWSSIKLLLSNAASQEVTIRLRFLSACNFK